MGSAGDRFVWGTETVRRSDGIPFLVYEPRRQSAAELLDGKVHKRQLLASWPAADVTDDRS